jgi:hypothetical protein
MIWLVAAIAALALPAVAVATQKHHPKKCPHGKHRSGRQCVKAHVARGPQGPAGAAGSPGTPGSPGAAGQKGDTGEQGVQGTSGPEGPQGSPGATGSQGANGAPGAPGATGPQGNPGAPGSPGGAGPQGPAGPAGPPGPPAPTNPLVYDNITPESRIANPPSLGYAATGTTQFGSQIVLAKEGGTTDPEVEVLMSVWSCESGGEATCVTVDPSATFAAPLTLNVYEVTYENAVGQLLATETQTFDLHYRPTTDLTCPDGTSFKASDGHCQHGLPQTVKFDLTGKIPHKAIVAVGFTPTTTALDSLNVAVEGPPTIGQNPVESGGAVYWDSQWFGEKTSTFRLDETPGEWFIGESQIAARVISTE